jgi:hypothetical protein
MNIMNGPPIRIPKESISPICSLILFSLAANGCQHGSPLPSTQPAAEKTLVGKWDCKASSDGSNVVFTLNPDKTMSFTATNGPKQPVFTETGVGTWDSTDKEFAITPLTIQIQCPSKTQEKALQSYVNKQVKVRSESPYSWVSANEFVVPKNGVSQHFKRVQG